MSSVELINISQVNYRVNYGASSESSGVFLIFGGVSLTLLAFCLCFFESGYRFPFFSHDSSLHLLMLGCIEYFAMVFDPQIA